MTAPYTVGERLFVRYTDRSGRVRRSPVVVERCDGPYGDPSEWASYRVTIAGRGFMATLPTDGAGTTRNNYLERRP